MSRVSTSESFEEPRVRLCVCADPAGDTALREAAEAMALQLALPVLHYPQAGFDGLVVVTPTGLELRWQAATTDVPGEAKRSSPIRCDMVRLDTRSGPGRSHRQPLARAVGLGKSSDGPIDVIDATGGLGEDAWLLAAWGCRVRLCERHAVIAAMLDDGLRRAGATATDIAARLSLHRGDACRYLEALTDDQRPDVVYLDPMYPDRDGTALQRKPMRIFRRLVGDDGDAPALFAIAKRAARRRVVVKRPADAPPLAPEPAAVHEGKGFRFDVYPTI
jgi:16S rRNA (guanine1516-N2)-methyltransferase